MSLASGHHRIMAAARGALVMMVLGKVGVLWTTHRKPSAASKAVLSTKEFYESERSGGRLFVLKGKEKEREISDVLAEISECKARDPSL